MPASVNIAPALRKPTISNLLSDRRGPTPGHLEKGRGKLMKVEKIYVKVVIPDSSLGQISRNFPVGNR